MLVAGPAAVESFPRSALFFLPVSLPSLGSQLARSQLLGFAAVTAPAAAGGEGRGPSLQVRAESCRGALSVRRGTPNTYGMRQVRGRALISLLKYKPSHS